MTKRIISIQEILQPFLIDHSQCCRKTLLYDEELYCDEIMNCKWCRFKLILFRTKTIPKFTGDQGKRHKGLTIFYELSVNVLDMILYNPVELVVKQKENLNKQKEFSDKSDFICSSSNAIDIKRICKSTSRQIVSVSNVHKDKENTNLQCFKIKINLQNELPGLPSVTKLHQILKPDIIIYGHINAIIMQLQAMFDIYRATESKFIVKMTSFPSSNQISRLSGPHSLLGGDETAGAIISRLKNYHYPTEAAIIVQGYIGHIIQNQQQGQAKSQESSTFLKSIETAKTNEGAVDNFFEIYNKRISIGVNIPQIVQKKCVLKLYPDLIKGHINSIDDIQHDLIRILKSNAPIIGKSKHYTYMLAAKFKHIFLYSARPEIRNTFRISYCHHELFGDISKALTQINKGDLMPALLENFRMETLKFHAFVFLCNYDSATGRYYTNNDMFFDIILIKKRLLLNTSPSKYSRAIASLNFINSNIHTLNDSLICLFSTYILLHLTTQTLINFSEQHKSVISLYSLQLDQQYNVGQQIDLHKYVYMNLLEYFKRLNLKEMLDFVMEFLQICKDCKLFELSCDKKRLIGYEMNDLTKAND